MKVTLGLKIPIRPWEEITRKIIEAIAKEEDKRFLSLFLKSDTIITKK